MAAADVTSIHDLSLLHNVLPNTRISKTSDSILDHNLHEDLFSKILNKNRSIQVAEKIGYTIGFIESQTEKVSILTRIYSKIEFYFRQENRSDLFTVIGYLNYFHVLQCENIQNISVLIYFYYMFASKVNSTSFSVSTTVKNTSKKPKKSDIHLTPKQKTFLDDLKSHIPDDISSSALATTFESIVSPLNKARKRYNDASSQMEEIISLHTNVNKAVEVINETSVKMKSLETSLNEASKAYTTSVQTLLKKLNQLFQQVDSPECDRPCLLHCVDCEALNPKLLGRSSVPNLPAEQQS